MFKFKPEDTVYCIDSFGIHKGVIQKCEEVDEMDIPYATCSDIYTVKMDCGEAKFLGDNVFKTYRSAMTEKVNRSKTLTKEYESRINNLTQLFHFMISHMQCDEYTDREAIRASKNKIKEITGIDMEE